MKPVKPRKRELRQTKTIFILETVLTVPGTATTKKQARAYVQDAMDKYDGGYFGNDLEPISVGVRRDVDKQ